jgi:hypothetical protein
VDFIKDNQEEASYMFGGFAFTTHEAPEINLKLANKKQNGPEPPPIYSFGPCAI